MTNESHDDDDFVLTISDDDGPLPYEEESGEFLAEAPALLANPKRKRAAEEEEEAEGIPASTIGSSKRQKKGKKGKAKEKNKKLGDSGINESADEIGVRKQDEDDGAMNSDFEFDAGDGNTGVVEDFDGWGGDDLAQLSVKEGPKKGVDIDEIIARRRARKTEPTEANGHTNGFQRQSLNKTSNGVKANVVGFEKGVNDVSDDNSEGQDGDADNRAQTEVDMSDDELLAPDGFGMGAADESDVDEEDGAELPEGSDSEEESVASPVPHPDDEVVYEANNDSDDPEEQARREAFFAPEAEGEKSQGKVETLSKSFQAMALSRPILRGLASVGFSDPTPIQAKTIPVALLGKDVVGGAVTGSGKTAAFMIPILERLLYRPKKVPTSRVAILMPTRELAVQCFNVARKLASFTDVTFCQLVGGFSLREQENVLKKRPDVIIATPGRFIDHMRNSASFTLDTLEILVLDEADRMLEDGFADELDEILTTIPKSRQTMLFSATMTSNVDKLIRVGLNRPVRLMVDAQRQTVGTLVQEFVRLRVGKEDKRLAYLMHLCTTIYTERCIVFFRQKKEAHRVRICFGLFGLRAAELHGSMTQEQRITSVESFRSGVVTHLLATDVASRGLDIKGVESVINYEAPQSHEIYLHRVGRTARAGRSGRACTIAAEPDRKVVKATVKAGKAQGAKIVSRIVEPPVVDAWIEKIEAVETEVAEILEEEKEERALGQVEMRVRKGENMMEHEAEIMARPKRTWFESEADKKAAKLKGRAELNGPDGGESRGLKRTAGKLSGKDKKKLDDRRDRKEGRTWKKGREEKEAGPRTGKGSKPKSAGKGKTNSKERGGKMKATFKAKSKSKNKARR